MFNNSLFENRAVYEIMWKNVVERGRPRMTIWRMRIACWIPKATDIHLEYVILIAFPLQQWLHGRLIVMLFVHCLSNHVDGSPVSVCHFALLFQMR
jgi:hypothetical protein